jgi:hypothetical protein
MGVQLSVTRDRRTIRRALGPKAADALLDMDARSIDAERFLLTWQHGGFLRRLWSVLTGKF